MARFLASQFIAFVLLAVPALCFGGLLPHECDCGPGGTEMECEHEDSCSEDPCEPITVSQDRDSWSLLDIDVSWVPVAVVPRDLELGSARWTWSARPPLPPDRRNLPYPQSDLPLLI